MDIAQTASKAFTRLASFIHAYPTIRDAIARENDEHDGYPTSVIGASAPTPGPPTVYEGTCREHVDTYGPDSYGPRRPALCGNERPCPDHDTPVAFTSVERHALARRGNRDHARIEAALDKITEGINTLEKIRASHIKQEVVTCNRGAGREGYIEWCDPLCGDVAEPDRGGLCSKCAKREYRWRKDRGLPSRNAA